MDNNILAQRLCEMVRFCTVSHHDRSLDDDAEFQGFQDYLRDTYPNVHSRCGVERVGKALIYKWTGQNPEAPCALFLTHYDVVEAKAEKWTAPPFGGVIKDGCVWGRGALDMKCQVMASFESAEALIAQGFTPYRTIYLILCADEETSDSRNAKDIAKLFRERGIYVEYALDEGTASILGADVFDTGRSLATIGIAEKGFGVIELKAKSDGGHASTPPRHTALGLIAQAIVNIENNPMRARRNPAVDAFFAAIGRYPGMMDETNPRVNALIRTTMAATMAVGSEAHNILPTVARAALNVRIAPHDTPDDVLQYVRSLCPEGVEARFTSVNPPSPISHMDSFCWRLLNAAVKEVFPDVSPVPYIMLASTDASAFSLMCHSVYRFSPYRHYYEFRDTIHAPDERIPIEDLADGVKFYTTMMQNT